MNDSSEASDPDRTGAPGPECMADAAGTAFDRGVAVRRFLDADGRERKRLLKELRPSLDREMVEAIAPAMRDPSPKVSARIASLLAKHGLDERFETLLDGLKPGKIEILRRHYEKMRKD